MKAMVAVCLCVLLGVGALPARGDFKYSDTAKITGGTLKSMMKTVGLFSKQASQAMKPMAETHYVKGNFMRSDDAEGRCRSSIWVGGGFWKSIRKNAATRKLHLTK